MTIYLAAGAPFAAARLLRTGPVETGWRRAAGVLLTLIVWPYTGSDSFYRFLTRGKNRALRGTDLGN